MQNLLKWMLLAILFFPVFFTAFRQKKWYLYLVCAFIGILPDNFAVELSESLPLLTAQRALILVLIGFWAVKKWKTRTWFVPVALAAYLGIHLVISVCNLHFGLSLEIKRLAVLVLEQALPVVLLADMIEDRVEFDRCIDMMLLSCAALSVIGICQTVFEFDIASVLQLVDPRSSTELTPRMDMTRAFGTSNAIIFGCYCAFMPLLCYYRLERTGKQRYSLILALDVLALLCTMSRSAWLCFLGVMGLLALVRFKKVFTRIWVSVALVVALFCGAVFINGNFGVAMLETGKSSLNTVLTAAHIRIPGLNADSDDPDEENKLEVSDKFGLNEGSAASSRLVEWSAVKYMTQEGHLLFGYGYNAFPRGMLHYFYPSFGFWTVADTLDVGLLAVMTETGLLGLLAELALYGYLLVEAFRKRGQKQLFTFQKTMLFLLVAHLLLNFMAAFTGPIWAIFGLFYANRRLQDKGLAEELPPANKAFWAF